MADSRCRSYGRSQRATTGGTKVIDRRSTDRSVHNFSSVVKKTSTEKLKENKATQEWNKIPW